MGYSRVSFRSVIDLIMSYSAQDRSMLSDTQISQIGGFINTRLKDWAWIAWPWPETTKTEYRRYRDNYASGTAYVAPTIDAGTEVYSPASGFYYQALRATTGNAPATLTSGKYVTNDAYWALAARTYSAPDWLDLTGYSLTNQVRNPDDGRVYQCHTAHTSSGSIDLTKFGVLTVFDPYIARVQPWEDNPVGEYLDMYREDPRVTRRPRRTFFEVDSIGAHVQAQTWDGRRWYYGLTEFKVPSHVWLVFRLPCPSFRGETFDPEATYAAGVDTVYFEGDTTDLEGDYWQCVTDTTAGDSPESAPAKWLRLDFPAWLQVAVARRAAADWLRYNGTREDAFREDAAADDSLFQTQIQLGAQQGKVLRWRKN